jgi:type IV pilus assembly protein PilZ
VGASARDTLVELPEPMDDASQPDRRRATRAPIQLEVQYRQLNGFFADYTRNLSRGGTFIRTERPLPVGTVFEFLLIVPHLAEPLTVHGAVTWTVAADQATDEQEPGMGIRFLDEGGRRELLDRTVERLMHESLGPELSERLLAGRDRAP